MLARGQAATEKLQAAPLKNLRYFSLQLQPDRHPGRLGDGAQRGRRGSRVTAWTQLQRSPFLGSCIPTPPPKALVHGGNQTHTQTCFKEAYRADSPEKKGIKDFCFETTASVLGT